MRHLGNRTREELSADVIAIASFASVLPLTQDTEPASDAPVDRSAQELRSTDWQEGIFSENMIVHHSVGLFYMTRACELRSGLPMESAGQVRF